MKLRYLIPVLFIFCISTGLKGNEADITITGNLEGVEDGSVIILSKTEGRVFEHLLTDTVKNGKFRFSISDTISEPKPMALMSRDEGFPSTWLEIWVAPGAQIEVTGEDKLLRTWDVKSNVPEQAELNKYRNAAKEYEKKNQLISLEISSLKKAGKNSDKKEEIKAKIDSLRKIENSMDQLILETEIDILKENRTYSRIWMNKLNFHGMVLRYEKLSDTYTDKLKDLYASLDEERKNSEAGQALYVSLNPPKVVAEGDDMADGDMWDTKGKLHRLADYKGKYLLLDFWSAGCGPCLMAMPEMKEISETYKERLFVISISSDTKELWKKTSEKKGITWINLNDMKGENGIKLQYGVSGIPHYVMVSPEGRIITSWAGYGKGSLKKKIKEIIKN